MRNVSLVSRGLWASAVCLVMTSSVASAQPPPGDPPVDPPVEPPTVPEPPKEVSSVADAARAAFEEGLREEAAGLPEDACDAYRRSLALVRELGPLTKVAGCDLRAGHILDGIRVYEEVLGRMPADDPERARIGVELDAAKKRVAHLKLKLGADAPVGTKARVNGKEVALPLADLPLDPGSHTVVVEAPGRAASVVTVTLADGATQEMVVPREEKAPALPVAPAERDRSLWIGGWVAGSVGLASFVVAGITGAKLLSEHSEFEDCQATPGCDAQAIADGVDGLLIANGWAFGIGAVGVAVGATLIIVDQVRAGEASDSPSVEARVGFDRATLTMRFQ